MYLFTLPFLHIYAAYVNFMTFEIDDMKSSKSRVTFLSLIFLLKSVNTNEIKLPYLRTYLKGRLDFATAVMTGSPRSIHALAD